MPANLFAKSFLPACLALSLLACSGLAPARAQDADNAATAAAKKAALVVEVTGSAPVAPTRYTVRVVVYAEGKGGRAKVRADFDKSVAAVRAALDKAGFPALSQSAPERLRRVDVGHYTGVSDSDPDNPDAINKVSSALFLTEVTREQISALFKATRMTGAVGEMIVDYSVSEISDGEACRRAALKAAVTHAKQRVAVLAEAARPKTFELLFIKEGDFELPYGTCITSLQDTRPLRLPTLVTATLPLTLFYGFKALPAPAKPAVSKPLTRTARRP